MQGRFSSSITRGNGLGVILCGIGGGILSGVAGNDANVVVVVVVLTLDGCVFGSE